MISDPAIPALQCTPAHPARNHSYKADFLLFRDVLTLHSLALVAPVLLVVNPALHGKHRILPASVEYVPNGQSSQFVAPAAAVYVPAGHLSQDVEPSW
jgi:hypothetical protein